MKIALIPCPAWKRQSPCLTGSSVGVGLLICSFIIFFSWFTLRKFEHGIWCGHDQGLGCQIFWTTLHGKLLWSSFLGVNGLCHLGEHAVFFILLWLPIYALFPFPVTLSILQVFFLGLSAVPVYLIAKDKISSRAGLLFVVLYLTNNFVIQAIIDGFQTRTISVPLYFFAFLFFIKKRYLWVSLFILLICFSHGIGCLIAIMFGIYMVLAQRKRLLGLTISILSLVWFIISIKAIQPHFGIAEPLGGLRFIAEGKVLTDSTLLKIA